MARYVLPVAGAAIGFAIGGAPGAYWGWTIGSGVGTLIDPNVIRGPSIGDIGQQTSQEGGPRPLIFGLSQPISGNVIATSEPRKVKKKSSGKGGPKVESEVVYRTYAVGICEGPISRICRVWRNGKLVYDVLTPDPATIVQDFLDVFFGNNLSFRQYCRFFLGGWDQEPSPDLETVLGVGTTPSHQGTAYVVMANEDLTDMRGAIPQWTFQVERCAVTLESVVDGCDVLLEWTEYIEADESTEYRLYRVHNGMEEIAYEGSNLSYTDEELEEFTLYQYFVRPVLNEVEVSQSNSTLATTQSCGLPSIRITAGLNEQYPGGPQRFGYSIDSDFDSPFGSISRDACYFGGPDNEPSAYIVSLYNGGIIGAAGGLILDITTKNDESGARFGNGLILSYVDEDGITRSFNTSDAVIDVGVPSPYGGYMQRWGWVMPFNIVFGDVVPVAGARFVPGKTYFITFEPPDDPP